MGKIVTGLSQLPDNTLEAKLYGALTGIHLAIFNIAQQIGEFTGLDEYPEANWSQLTPADTLTTGNSTRLYLPAGANLTAGQIVNMYDNAGTLSVRLAQANAASTMAHGIVNNTVLAGDIAEINYLRSYVDSIGGMTIGTLYYLDPTVAGAITNARPAAAGQIIQPIGVALSASTLAMDITLGYIQL